MSWNTIIKVILVIITFLLLINQLCEVSHPGKLIIKAEASNSWAIFWVGILIFEIILIVSYTMKNMPNNDIMIYLNNNILNIDILAISITCIIMSHRDKEIRENGIFSEQCFYKWSKVKSYSWTSGNTFQLNVNTSFKTNKNLEFTIKEELRPKTEEVLQKYITSKLS